MRPNHDSGGRGHKTRADHDTARDSEETGHPRGTKLTVEAKGGKIVFSKVPSIFDLVGKSKMTKDEAFRLLDKMREGG